MTATTEHLIETTPVLAAVGTLLTVVLGMVFAFLWRISGRFTEALVLRDSQFIDAIDRIESRHEAGELRSMEVAAELVADCKAVIRENSAASIEQAKTNTRVAIVLERVESSFPKSEARRSAS